MTAPPRRHTTRVRDVRTLSPACYELVLDRPEMPFEAGQLVTLHGRDATEDRSYTVCSGQDEARLDILYRLIPEGVLTPQLARLEPGDTIDLSGPYGQFVLRDAERPLFFFATGTGVAPYRSYLRSHADLRCTLVHGVRYTEDLVYREEFTSRPYYPCVSREPGPGYHGRITDFATTLTLEPEAHYYLCGANEMIFDLHRLLTGRGIDEAHIFTEPYYYHADD